MIDGFGFMVGLWVWTVLMLAHALWRSTARPQPDAIRSSGPVEHR